MDNDSTCMASPAMLSCYLRRSAQVFAFSIWQPWQAIGDLTFGRSRRHMGSKTTSSSRRIGRRWSGPKIGVSRRSRRVGRRWSGPKIGVRRRSRRIGRRWMWPDGGVSRRALSGPSSLNEVASPDGQFDFAVSATLAAAAGGLGLCPTPLSPPCGLPLISSRHCRYYPYCGPFIASSSAPPRSRWATPCSRRCSSAGCCSWRSL